MGFLFILFWICTRVVFPLLAGGLLYLLLQLLTGTPLQTLVTVGLLGFVFTKYYIDRTVSGGGFLPSFEPPYSVIFTTVWVSALVGAAGAAWLLIHYEFVPPSIVAK